MVLKGFSYVPENGLVGSDIMCAWLGNNYFEVVIMKPHNQAATA